MSPDPCPTQSRDIRVGALVTLAALSSTAVGAAFAKTLIQAAGATGVAGLRIAIAGVMIFLVRRPWRRRVSKDLLAALATYGVMLGLMNLLIYQAFARIPIGIAVAIEVTGPLTVVLLGSRQYNDLLWLGIAIVGFLLLVPSGSTERLNWMGVGFAAASGLCWALYIISGKRVAVDLGGDAAAWGLLIATIVFLPMGFIQSGTALLTPHILGSMIVIALLSSAVPYSLEIMAMQRLPAALFGLISSAAPAVSAVSGFFLLDERLSLTQWGAVLCIMIASAGGMLAAPGRKAKAMVKQASH